MYVVHQLCSFWVNSWMDDYLNYPATISDFLVYATNAYVDRGGWWEGAKMNMNFVSKLNAAKWHQLR